MGLLDGLPQGLLDFLQNNAVNQNLNTGLGSDTAGYQPAGYQAPLGFMPQQQAPQQQPEHIYRPNEINPIDQAMASPATDLSGAARSASPPMSPPPIVQAQAAPQSPGVGDRMASAFRGIGANATAGPIGMLMGGIAGLTGMNNQSNATEQALLSRGVDPATVKAARENPDIMKTLVAQTFGPQTVTSIGEGYVYNPRTGKTERAYTPDKAPTALGQGYIYNPTTHKVEQAYQPEDKIPAGFAKGDDGQMHFIPGGPADPAYLRMAEAQKKDPNGVFTLGRGGELYKIENGQPVIVHKNEADTPEATLDTPTTKAMAAQYLAGDKSVMQNLGRGAQGAANIVKLRTEIYSQANDQGMDGKAIVNNFNEQAGAVAGQRSIGTRAANISLAANEANNMIPIALDASAKVPRGEWMPWNKMVQAYQTGTSSPELARFVAATNSLVNSYVRAVSPSGVPTDSMREHAYSMLNSAQSPKAYEAVTSIMQDEMKAAMAAPGQVRKELRHEPETAATSTSGGINKTSTGVQWTVGK